MARATSRSKRLRVIAETGPARAGDGGYTMLCSSAPVKKATGGPPHGGLAAHGTYADETEPNTAARRHRLAAALLSLIAALPATAQPSAEWRYFGTLDGRVGRKRPPVLAGTPDHDRRGRVW